MASFNHSARCVLRSTAVSSGHDWIAFLRCVEAFAACSGRSFHSVLARAGIAPGSRPRTAQLQAAVRWMKAERDALLAERRHWMAVQREAKRRGRRAEIPEPLQALESASRHAFHPRVGVFGWQELRERGPGDHLRLSFDRPAPPLYRSRRGYISIDLRTWPERVPPSGLAEAILDQHGRSTGTRIWTTRDRARGWTVEDVHTTTLRLRRLSYSRPTLWVVCSPTDPDLGLDPSVLEALKHARWAVGRLGAPALG